MTKKKTKMGRPPMNEKDKKVCIITVRLKKAERKQLEKEAATKGLEMSTYLLQCWQKSRAKKWKLTK